MTSLNNKLNNMVIPTILTGLSGLPTDYRTRIKNFLREYLGTPKQPVPFGGRQQELTALDEWLHDPSAPPYALLAAEAGRGKSALLVQWTQSLIARDLAHVVFVPVSIRFNTALATTFFTVLAARLGELYGEPVQWANLSAQQWREVCQSYLNHPWPHDNPLVIIVDGLDEAADWQAGADLFPLHPPSGLRVVVSARYLAGDTDESGWRNRLGWPDESQARSLPVPRLTIEGVRDILHQMGDPLDQLAGQVDIVGQLYRLCEGDPLLMRLYIDALLPYGDRTAAIRPEELPSIKDGLAGYFERWWEDQEELWAKQTGDPLAERQEVLEFFNICATALGPLTRHDIATIAGGSFASEEHLQQIASQVKRFIIGGTQRQGYTFSHPRLGYYFWERMEPAEQEAWNAHFLDFGQRTLEALNNGTLEPQNAPPYAIQYYGAHLERTNAPTDAFYALVSSEWMRAWEVLEGTHAGFLNDVQYAWQRAEAERDLAMQIKCALCRASIVALEAEVRGGIKRPINDDMWGEINDDMSGQINDGELQSIALWALVHHLPDQLLSQVLQTIDVIDHDEWFSAVLDELVPHLSEELLGELLEALQNGMPWTWEHRLRPLAPYLSDELLGEALEVVRVIGHESEQVNALKTLTPHLPDELLGEALEVVRSIHDPSERAEGLKTLAPHLPGELLGEGLGIVRAIRDPSKRAEVLKAFTSNLPDELFGKQLEAVRAINDPWQRVEALKALVPHLPDEFLCEALEVVRAINHSWERVEALKALVPHLPDELLGQALEAAGEINDPSQRVKALKALAPHLPDELLGEALSAVRVIHDPWQRVKALKALVPHLPDKLLGEALEMARSMNDPRRRVDTLNTLAPHFSDKLFADRLKAARQIDDRRSRVNAFLALVPHFFDEFLNSTLEVPLPINNQWRRTQLIELFASHLPDELLDSAFELAESTNGQANAVQLFASLNADELFAQMFDKARAINDPRARSYALTRLMHLKPSELLGEALEAAWAINDHYKHPNASVIWNEVNLFVPHWLQTQPSAAYIAWAKTIRHLSKMPRPTFLERFYALVIPITLSLAGEEADTVAVSIFHAIEEVCEWWP